MCELTIDVHTSSLNHLVGESKHHPVSQGARLLIWEHHLQHLLTVRGGLTCPVNSLVTKLLRSGCVT